MVSKLFGVSKKDAKAAISGVRGSSLKLEWLKSRFQKLLTYSNDTSVLYAARAYVMYIFGCSIFTDKSGARVSTFWLYYLEDMDRLHEYTWGAATLAYLYRHLGLASKAKVKQMAGYLTLLEAWIYLRFPRFVRPPPNPAYRDNMPISMRWSSVVGGASMSNVRALRERIDSMTPDEMIWSPYTPSVRETYPFDPVTLFHGCISAGDIVEPYLPERVLRQFDITNRVSQSQQNLLITLAQHFGSWDVHTLIDDRLGTPVYCSWDSSPDYMEWFVSHSHPRVQNPAQRVIGDSTSIPTFNVQPYEAIANARSLMEPLLSRWRSDDIQR
ncbi:hypothetical protein ACS0TY_034437 [Phlomoides rotata]